MPRSTRKTTKRTASRVGTANPESDSPQGASSRVNVRTEDVENDDPQALALVSRSISRSRQVSNYFVGEEEGGPSARRAKRGAPSSPDRDDERPVKRPWEPISPGPSSWALQTVAMPARRDPNGHSITYHHPLLLNNLAARENLLAWFDSVASNRAMPWRKPWVNPAGGRSPAALRRVLKKRAYDVWISEVMLQQTRVATVIEYWKRWMIQWPTIHDLAAADHQEVLDAWRGLGYYSRATRIHKAAKTICEYFDGLIPDDPDVLEANMDGVGKYTAGAITAIVFGKAVPLVDGNVLRVLSRQMGLFGDVQKDKKVITRIWDAAGELAKQVVRDEVENHNVNGEHLEDERVAVDDDEALPPSDKPGQWGQALMELGSTLCTPLKPDCTACPISSTCRAHSEGFALAIHSFQISAGGIRLEDYEAPAPKPREQVLVDIEDLCTECDAEQEEEAGLCADGNLNVKFRQVNKGKPYLVESILTPDHDLTVVRSARGFALISHHAEKYPPKPNKKKSKIQDSHVFALRRVSDGRYMIQRRPPNGLLPNMWELPSDTVATTTIPRGPDTARDPRTGQLFEFGTTTSHVPVGEISPTERLNKIINATELLISPPREEMEDLGQEFGTYCRDWDEAGGPPKIHRVAQLGTIPWTFSHIKMTMHVHLYELDDTHPDTQRHHHWTTYGRTQRWLTPDQVDEMTMGSGMAKCWDLVKQAVEEGQVSDFSS